MDDENPVFDDYVTKNLHVYVILVDLRTGFVSSDTGWVSQRLNPSDLPWVLKRKPR